MSGLFGHLRNISAQPLCTAGTNNPDMTVAREVAATEVVTPVAAICIINQRTSDLTTF